ncbi:unnamed protein product [Bursaphelenchus xylophilus]|uniref:(pine wood nematode) hypothetical protein n=1 Tax=Bursaphelenchus xylophilus TaxID=6326 RepID=A0A1I7RWT9_BURXY|nr:unnamed protein product [Bursaphelenchus xylophilus]CAG9128685.1 unnamed protein product [Bursaphelenchus xylophilus]
MNISDDVIQFYAIVRKYHWCYELFLGATSLTLNSIVVYMAMTTRNRVIGSFCYVVIMSLISDIIYAAANVISMMVVEVKGGLLYFITLGPFSHSGYPYNFLMCSIYLAGLYMVFFSIGLQFIYRYFALCRSHLTIFQFSMLFVATTAYCALEAFTGFLVFDGETPEGTELIREHPMYMHDTPTYIIVDPRKPAAKLHILSTQLNVIFMYIVIFYTGRKINSKLREASKSMSQSTKNAQRQLTRVMVLQAVYPTIIICIPTMVATVFTQLRMDAAWAGLYMVPCATLVPFVNSVTLLLVIPSFRRRFFGSLPFRKSQVGQTTMDSKIISLNPRPSDISVTN